MKAKRTKTTSKSNHFKIGIGLILALGIWGGARVWQQATRPVVSILMTVQDQEQTLAAAIDSVRGQTLADWELIAVDMASADKSSRILADYANQDSRVRVITMPADKKRSAALNKGLLNARGKYVAFAPADSVSDPKRLARQVAFMEAKKIDLSAGVVQDPMGTDPVSVSDTADSERLKVDLIFDNIFPEAAAMVNRDFLSSKHLKFSVDHLNAEIYDLWLRLVAEGGRLGILGGEPVVRQSAKVLSETESRKQRKSIRRSRARFVRRIVSDIRERSVELDKCDLFPILIEGNKETEFLDQKVLADSELQACVPNLYFVAPDWSGYLAPIRGRRFRRMDRPDEKATLTRNGRGIVVEWDQKTAEQYECTTTTCIRSGYRPKP